MIAASGTEMTPRQTETHKRDKKLQEGIHVTEKDKEISNVQVVNWGSGKGKKERGKGRTKQQEEPEQWHPKMRTTSKPVHLTNTHLSTPNYYRYTA